MTRADYIALAKAIATSRVRFSGYDEIADLILDDAAEMIAGVLAFDNPRFDKDRFLQATREYAQ